MGKLGVFWHTQGSGKSYSMVMFTRKVHRKFECSPEKNTTVQSLRQAVEDRLQRLLQQNPLRTDFQQHYEQIVSEYNREKDRVTIERAFEALFTLVQELDDEEHRAVREGLDEESLAVFDLIGITGGPV
jgi:type I restriction enzyme R subunit